jgi:RNA polymerase sigma-70 factor (ECF subfamily)
MITQPFDRPTCPTRHRPESTDDARLLAVIGSRGRDAEWAMAELHRRHATVIRAAVRRRHGNAVVDDVVQETFLRAWRNAAQFDPARGNAGGWLRTIALNSAVDLLRSRRRSVTATVCLPDADAAATSDEAVHEHTDLRCTMRSAMATLSAEHRTVIDFAYRLDLSQSQIASRLGLPLGTVKTRTFWALAALRRQLATTVSAA